MKPEEIPKPGTRMTIRQKDYPDQEIQGTVLESQMAFGVWWIAIRGKGRRNPFLFKLADIISCKEGW